MTFVYVVCTAYAQQLMGTTIHGVLIFTWVLLNGKLAVVAQMGTTILSVLVIKRSLYF